MNDVASLTDGDLDILARACYLEQSRRATLAQAPALIEKARDDYQAASGRQDGDEWKQPLGAHDAYRLDAITTHDGKEWVSLVDFNVWEPGVTGWREKVTAPTIPAWVQPLGAHDQYQPGDKVTHKGHIWNCVAVNNVWEPGVYGWTDTGPA